MRPSERTIREALRREAAQVPVPDDMWKQISRQLDHHPGRGPSRNPMPRRADHWKPLFAFVAAAGIFWLTVLPTGGRGVDPLMPKGHASEVIVPFGQEVPMALEKQLRREQVRLADSDSLPIDRSAYLNHPTTANEPSQY